MNVIGFAVFYFLVLLKCHFARNLVLGVVVLVIVGFIFILQPSLVHNSKLDWIRISLLRVKVKPESVGNETEILYKLYESTISFLKTIKPTKQKFCNGPEKDWTL